MTQTTDLEQRLRALASREDCIGVPLPIMAELARLRAENEALREALGQIVQWADAYPREVFEEPDLEAVKTLLTDAGMRVQMDRMHAAWARHLTEGFGRIARQALQEGSRHE